MKMTSVSKVQYANLNDKQYYFSDEIFFFILWASVIIRFACIEKILSKNQYCHWKRKKKQITKDEKLSCCKKRKT